MQEYTILKPITQIHLWIVHSPITIKCFQKAVQVDSSVMSDVETHNKEKDMLLKSKEERPIRLKNKMKEYRTEKTMCVSRVRP